jgi:hypothetical protein
MKNISSYVEELYPEEGTEKITSEWQLIVKDFLDTLNKDREGKYKPYNVGQMLSMMKRAGIKGVQGHKAFLFDCQKAKNFGAYFHWYIKNKK